MPSCGSPEPLARCRIGLRQEGPDDGPKGRTTMPRHDGSRRRFLQGAALAAGGAIPLLPTISIAQTADPELTRLTGARRILIKGAVVLTLDRQVGDFAQADLLIEDGKIRELRPSIAASGND